MSAHATPLDLQLAGFEIRTRAGGYIHWRANGRGEICSLVYDTVEEAVADARHLMTGRAGQRDAQWFLVGLE